MLSLVYENYTYPFENIWGVPRPKTWYMDGFSCEVSKERYFCLPNRYKKKRSQKLIDLCFFFKIRLKRLLLGKKPYHSKVKDMNICGQ